MNLSLSKSLWLFITVIIMVIMLISIYGYVSSWMGSNCSNYDKRPASCIDADECVVIEKTMCQERHMTAPDRPDLCSDYAGCTEKIRDAESERDCKLSECSCPDGYKCVTSDESIFEGACISESVSGEGLQRKANWVKTLPCERQ